MCVYRCEKKTSVYLCEEKGETSTFSALLVITAVHSTLELIFDNYVATYLLLNSAHLGPFPSQPELVLPIFNSFNESNLRVKGLSTKRMMLSSRITKIG